MGQSHSSPLGTILISVFMNTTLFGLVSQQFYTYWINGFKDPIHWKLFVIVQYLLVTFQCTLMWNFIYNVFVIDLCSPTSNAGLWAGPLNSLCQVIIILLANLFLAVRIHTLTKSRIQSGTVVSLSTFAFIFGMVTVVSTWRNSGSGYHQVTSVIWHTAQAVAECFITFFLARALLNARSGVRRSDTVVNYLVRNVIQTGFLATVWAIAELVTWFLLPNIAAYRVFDITSGTIYTHALFETLLSRIRLRQDMSTSLSLNSDLRAQSHTSRRSRVPVKVSNLPLATLGTSESEPGPSFIGKSDAFEMVNMPKRNLDGQW
ncbi:hypothetical protein BJV74DRAFT_285554 [Russula compacta]|nr:hypothetical protein BJV74DRAFT_285554 [Russula compacta]